MGKDPLLLTLLEEDIDSYWKLSAKLSSSQATVVDVQEACYIQEVCLIIKQIIKQTYELCIQWQNYSEIRAIICKKITFGG